ncbi:MAG: LysR family transcriptional regulator ArgP, partial [Kofleriaceae bacterium]
MDLIHPQLVAFAAVLEEGSFEAAARRLAVTPSAVSQRIKALEDRLGQVLVVRQAPCRPTPAGERLLRRVRPMQALEAEALADFLPEERSEGAARSIAIAVNDDSLETWFVAALSRLHAQYGYVFDVRVDDQDHTLDLLRDGSVLGAVTAEAIPPQGCNVRALGTMRYRAVASPAFAARYFAAGVDAAALARAPMIVFNRKDALQWRYMRRITRARLAPPVHYLPSATGFVEAGARGRGGCLAPESLIAPARQAQTNGNH